MRMYRVQTPRGLRAAPCNPALYTNVAGYTSPDMVAAAAEAQARGYSVPYNVYSGPGGSTLVGVVNPDCTLGQTFPDRPEASNPSADCTSAWRAVLAAQGNGGCSFVLPPVAVWNSYMTQFGAAQAIQQNQAVYQAVVETSQQQAAIASPGVQPSQYIPVGQPGSYSATQIAAENAAAAAAAAATATGTSASGTTPAAQPGSSTGGTSSSSSSTGSSGGSGLPDTIGGIKTTYVLIGGAAVLLLLVMSGGRR